MAFFSVCREAIFTFFSQLPLLKRTPDIILGTVVDYVHCSLEGVMKLLLELWFSSRESQEEPFDISKHVDKDKDVDRRIGEIKAPNRISRCPRSIEGHRKYWKANKLRAFFSFLRSHCIERYSAGRLL